jgi:predicted CXXCH cytochrome family protein
VVHKPVARGRCLTCHDSHGSDDRGLLSAGVPSLCIKCHKKNIAMKEAHGGRSLNETDCTACHDPHASKVKGLLRNNQHKPFATGNCTQCHGDLDTGGSFAIAGGNQDLCLKCHRGVESFKSATNKHNMESERSCVACHNPHAANGENLLLRSQVDLCMGCHFNDVKAGEKDRYITHDGIDCVNCHQPHGNDDPQLLIARDAQLCAGCHEAAHRVSHPIGPEVIDPRTEEEVTCLSCHQLHGADFAKYLPLNPDMALCIQCHKK